MAVFFQDRLLAGIEVMSNLKSLCPISAPYLPIHLNPVHQELLLAKAFRFDAQSFELSRGGHQS
jgi:hypothetical protein